MKKPTTCSPATAAAMSSSARRSGAVSDLYIRNLIPVLSITAAERAPAVGRLRPHASARTRRLLAQPELRDRRLGDERRAGRGVVVPPDRVLAVRQAAEYGRELRAGTRPPLVDPGV